MTKNKGLKIYIIRHKESGEAWLAPSGKSSWKSSGNAKNAWGQLCSSAHLASYYGKKYGVPLVQSPYGGTFPEFDEQRVYEIVEVNSLAGEIVAELRDIIEKLIELIPDENEKLLQLQRYKDIERRSAND